MCKSRASASSSPAPQRTASTKRSFQRSCLADGGSLPSSTTSCEIKASRCRQQTKRRVGHAPAPRQVPVPEQLQTHLASSMPQGVDARTTLHSGVCSRGCPIVYHRGVHNRFTPRPVVPYTREAMPSHISEIPAAPTKKHMESWVPAAKQAHPIIRKPRSLSNGSAQHAGVTSSSVTENPRKRRSVQLDRSVQQEILEDRIHILEEQIRELTKTKFQEVRPDSPQAYLSEPACEVSCDHFFNSNLKSSPSYDDIITEGTNTPNFPHHSESSADGSVDGSPASPAPSCVIASPDGGMISPLQECELIGSSSHLPYRCSEFEDNDENRHGVKSELATEAEVLRAEVAKLSMELTACKESTLQVERNFRETTLEYQRSMKILLLQLEKAEATRTSGSTLPGETAAVEQ